MTTDYKNLTGFEAAAIVMIAVGLALISFQIFVSLPDRAQVSVSSSLSVLNLTETMRDVRTTVWFVNEFGVQSMVAFYEEFNTATEQIVFHPIAKATKAVADDYIAVAHGFAQMSDYLASNYQSNYVIPGVEGDVGGKVMGAYFEKLTQ